MAEEKAQLEQQKAALEYQLQQSKQNAQSLQDPNGAAYMHPFNPYP